MLTAFTQKGAAIPKATVSAPPSAGPTARLTFTPALFIAIAAGSSAFGTSAGTTDCHAGAPTADPDSIRKVHSRSETGLTTCSQTNTANNVETTAMKVSARIRNRRLSTMSARAPAGRANSTIGSVAATCTSDTMSGSASRLVISHADAELYIQPPMFDTSVALQTTAKVACRNGLQGE